MYYYFVWLLELFGEAIELIFFIVYAWDWLWNFNEYVKIIMRKSILIFFSISFYYEKIISLINNIQKRQK